MARPLYPVTLVNKHSLSRNTVQLDFRMDGDSGFEFIAGQFIQFHIQQEGKLQKRSYSIANSPEAFSRDGILEVALSFVDNGLASQFFAQAEPGLELVIGGPFGILTLPDSHSGKLILAGTGTGLAPYRAMLPDLKQLAQNGVPITVIMGVRKRSDLIYEDDFREFADSVLNASYRVCFSRENGLDPSRDEHPGYVQNQFASLELQPETDLVYLCGNPAMIDDAAEVLKNMSFGPRQIKREKYVYSGH
ncbi:MAG: FAD-binding oxidoreductase [Endozoicomonas sp.]